MEIKDILNASRIKAENDSLREMMSPELQDVATLQEKISDMETYSRRIDSEIRQKQVTLSGLEQRIFDLRKQVITFEDNIVVQEFGLYQPRYSYATSDEYKAQLAQVRDRQKVCLKSDQAATGSKNFTFNNSQAQGSKMVKDMQKLLLRAFNSECDEIINNIKYNNYDMSLKKMCTSSDAVTKLGKMLSISITGMYFDLKKQELTMALEYQLKKQEEKEALKQARSEMKEQAKLQKELEEQRKKIEKEQTHYQHALQQIIRQLESPQNTNNQDLLTRRAELEQQLGNIDVSLRDLDYREANQRAGYVYVISNIGAFGENVYKIGMTRRLDPQDRVDELGDASVPFNFDVHAMVFSDDAPALEAALHRAFEDRKVNMVNQRREFFYVSLNEIKEVIKRNFDKTVEFYDVPDAEQYRISQRIASEHGNVQQRQRIAPSQSTTPSPSPPPVPVALPNQSRQSSASQSATAPKEKLYTRWGIYIMPQPYKINLAKGPRNDLIRL